MLANSNSVSLSELIGWHLCPFMFPIFSGIFSSATPQKYLRWLGLSSLLRFNVKYWADEQRKNYSYITFSK